MIRSILVSLVLLCFAESAHAQARGPLFKYGKWVLAAGALGMNYLAAKDHDRADDNFDLLEQRCFANSALCDLNDSGRYRDELNEIYYQQSVHYDRRARRLLIAGEAALIGSATIFVLELTRRTSKPNNIPFEADIRSLRQATGVGLRVSF
jgi:hypothetical protein